MDVALNLASSRITVRGHKNAHSGPTISNRRGPRRNGFKGDDPMARNEGPRRPRRPRLGGGVPDLSAGPSRPLAGAPRTAAPARLGGPPVDRLRPPARDEPAPHPHRLREPGRRAWPRDPGPPPVGRPRHGPRRGGPPRVDHLG